MNADLNHRATEITEDLGVVSLELPLTADSSRGDACIALLGAITKLNSCLPIDFGKVKVIIKRVVPDF